ncbi:MAG: hypothetical protein ACFFC7_08695 [Candidatus Hermodarchaeota archaeon]
MTSQATFLEDDDRKKLLQELETIYGIPPDVFNRYEFVVRGKRQKIWIVTSAVRKFSILDLKPVYYGMYFAKKDKTGLRLTMNGAQVFGYAATKNIVDLNKHQYLNYLSGEKIIDMKSENLQGYVLLRHKNRIFACGKASKEGILNYVPKSRQLHK